MSNLVIKGGRIIDPANHVDQVADLYIIGRHIAAVGNAPTGFIAATEIDASNQIVCPGLIDLCARLREPGFEYKATIASETTAAAASGITSLCCPPDTQPIIDTPAVADLIQHQAQLSGMARVHPIGAQTQQLEGKQLSEMAALKGAGCVAVSNASMPIANALITRRTLEYAATHDILVILQPEDYWLRDNGYIHEGQLSCKLGIPGIPESAETVAVASLLVLVEQTGVRAHFGRLSSARAVDMIAEAKARDLAITADVSAHQLFLTDANVESLDPNCHVNPPLRTETDRQRLRSGLADGTIDAICSDHQPHELDAKNAPFPATEPGISALETFLPLTLQLVKEGVIDINRAIALTTSQPASIIGSLRGSLSIDADADVCVFSADKQWQLNHDDLVSRGHNTPFIGSTLTGKVSHTVLGGQVVYKSA